jgi:hypothetical protein
MAHFGVNLGFICQYWVLELFGFARLLPKFTNADNAANATSDKEISGSSGGTEYG